MPLKDYWQENVEGSQFRKAFGQMLSLKSETEITDYLLENCNFQWIKIEEFEEMVIDLQDSNEVQQSPCVFGTFCIIYNGEIISHHPISNTRFENIMKKKIKMTNYIRDVSSMF